MEDTELLTYKDTPVRIQITVPFVEEYPAMTRHFDLESIVTALIESGSGYVEFPITNLGGDGPSVQIRMLERDREWNPITQQYSESPVRQDNDTL